MIILSRLLAKSVARFHCVSKRWASTLDSPNFKELFLTKSSAKPLLLFAIEEEGIWSFFSSPQLENPYEKSSSTLVAAATFHVKFSPDNLRINHYYDLRYFSIGYASGLIYIYGNRHQARPLICHPNTGRYAILPYRYTDKKAYSFFGFEPIDKQYKVLSMAYPCGPGHDKVLTFGAGDMTWRRIKCSLRHDAYSEGVCINGVLYYLGDTSDCYNDGHDVTSRYVIVCFDLRSEKFTFIGVERSCGLINYKSKLAVIFWEDDDDFYSEDGNAELRVWVLEDIEKHEWSKYAYTWTDGKFFRRQVSMVGVTTSGDIVFSMCKYTFEEPFYVFYLNPERKTLQRVEIQGFGEVFKETCSVCTFVNHVQNRNVNHLKLLKSDHPPLVEPEYYGYLQSESDSECD